ncbi:MAG: glutathione S-transferase family protein [Desulforhopalus sp.]
MKLVIGNKNYSSWSLRAWLMLAANNIEFEEVVINLNKADTAVRIAEFNKAGKVPVILDGDLIVWDSLAICEYISETYLDNNGWPKDSVARAQARACCAEMHSGFFELREKLPMNCRASGRSVRITPQLQKEIYRIDSLWSEFRTRYQEQGDYLFGKFSIADCMFAPVVFRFATYGIGVSDISKRYMQKMLSHPKVELWLEQARAEDEIIEADEVGGK